MWQCSPRHRTLAVTVYISLYLHNFIMYIWHWFCNSWIVDKIMTSDHRLIKTQIGHARDFTWYRGQRPSPARVILSHERVQIHARENLWVTRQIRHTFACVSCYCATFRLHFNHARRGRALAAISGKVPSVSGVCLWARAMYRPKLCRKITKKIMIKRGFTHFDHGDQTVHLRGKIIGWARMRAASEPVPVLSVIEFDCWLLFLFWS